MAILNSAGKVVALTASDKPVYKSTKPDSSGVIRASGYATSNAGYVERGSSGGFTSASNPNDGTVQGVLTSGGAVFNPNSKLPTIVNPQALSQAWATKGAGAVQYNPATRTSDKAPERNTNTVMGAGTGGSWQSIVAMQSQMKPISASATGTVGITILPRPNFSGLYSYSASATGTIGITILPRANTTNTTENNTVYFYEDLNHKYWNTTHYYSDCTINSSGNEICKRVAYNTTRIEYKFYNNTNITISGTKGREASECINAKSKDWDYYRLSLFAMGFDVSGQTQDFIDMIINNMGENSYYHRCLKGF